MPDPMILTIDIGNSRIKWASWQEDKITARGIAAYDEKQMLSEDFDELFSLVVSSPEVSPPEGRPSRVFVVCVAGENIVKALNQWLQQHWKLDAEYLKTEKQFDNIINAYDDPAQHGVDRWASVVAGHQRYRGSSLCVIGAGTAITIDLIHKNGRHLGGYILPSYDIMHAALLSDTTNVASTISLQFQQQGIPDNTNDAVNQGLHRLLQAGIREFCRFAEDEMGEPTQIIVTGGFAKTILDYPDMPLMQHEPDLVMQGLYNIMMQQSNTAER